MLISHRDSLLEKAAEAEVCAEPFPHVVIHEPIRAELCDRLISEYPPLDVISRRKSFGNNKRFSYAARYALAGSRISPLWREFVELHISNGFWQQVRLLFRQHILARYPTLATERGGLDAWRAGVRGLSTSEDVDILLDAQICANTPVLEASSSVRGPHVDEPDKLFAGLFYLRPSNDQSEGGDLELYRFRGAVGGYRGVQVDDSHIELAKVIPYRSNVLVLFINSEQAVHGVTPRLPTATPRWLFNLIGVAHRPLFDLQPFQLDGSAARARPHAQPGLL